MLPIQNIQKPRQSFKKMSDFFARKEKGFYECDIKKLSSHWAAVIENDGEYFLIKNIQINTVYIHFYISLYLFY